MRCKSEATFPLSHQLDWDEGLVFTSSSLFRLKFLSFTITKRKKKRLSNFMEIRFQIADPSVVTFFFPPNIPHVYVLSSPNVIEMWPLRYNSCSNWLSSSTGVAKILLREPEVAREPVFVARGRVSECKGMWSVQACHRFFFQNWKERRLKNKKIFINFEKKTNTRKNGSAWFFILSFVKYE